VPRRFSELAHLHYSAPCPCALFRSAAVYIRDPNYVRAGNVQTAAIVTVVRAVLGELALVLAVRTHEINLRATAAPSTADRATGGQDPTRISEARDDLRGAMPPALQFPLQSFCAGTGSAFQHGIIGVSRGSSRWVLTTAREMIPTHKCCVDHCQVEGGGIVAPSSRGMQLSARASLGMRCATIFAASKTRTGKALGDRIMAKFISLGVGIPMLVVIFLPAAEPKLAEERTAGKLEVVATFDGPMPTGVTVSHKGRIFVNFPRWGDAVTYTVAEVKDGKPSA
jgi:hypothetical protein